MKIPQLDKYAKDARAWSDWSRINYTASLELFKSDNLVLWFPAAVLGHHALEMYLKTALICEGMTRFDPKLIPKLDPTIGLTKADCAWGHELVKLAEQLSYKRDDFDLATPLNLPPFPIPDMPNSLRDGFDFFEPFSSELPYPKEMQRLSGVGQEQALVLVQLFMLLQPFANRVSP